jgi:hypothetical protein
MRVVWLLSILLALRANSIHATNIWISPSGTSSAPPADPSELPVLRPSGTAYVWAQVDPGRELLNWSLNVHTSNPNVANLTGVRVYNPLIGGTASHPPPKHIHRYEYVNEPAPDENGQSIEGFSGYTVTNSTVIGAGIGEFTASIEASLDPRYYDPDNLAFLIAAITYKAAERGTTGLYLQIGPNGLNNANERSRDTEVVFGAITDPALNGESGRNLDSATPEAHITVTEPSTLLFFCTGFMALCSRLARRR